MKSFFTPIILLLCSTTFAQGSFDYAKDFKVMLGKTKDTSNDLSYNRLLKRFISNDNSMTRYETLALMIGYTAQTDYRPFDDLVTEKDIFILNDNGNYQEALQEADPYLATHPLSLRVLKEKSYSLHQLKKADSSDYYMDLVHKIMSAMLFSGNGKTPDTPIFALGLTDGERFMENAGYLVGNKGTSKSKTGLNMQLVDGSNDEGTHVTLLFVIQHAIDKAYGDEKEVGGKKDNKKSKKKNKKDKDQPAKE